MTPIQSLGPSFGCGNSQSPRFGNTRLNTEISAQINKLDAEHKQCQQEAIENAKTLDGYNGFDQLLQSGLLLAGGATAFFGAPIIGAALATYPIVTNIYQTIQNLKK